MWQGWRREGQAWRYLRCPGCGLRRLDPLPTPDQLAAVFDDGYFAGGGERGGYQDYDADAAIHLANARKRLRGLLAGPGLLVDVGCASGYALLAAQERGWRAVGVEVSPAAAARARDAGFRVEATTTDLADLTGQVDAISYFQVLEHLPDPLGELSRAASLLRPGGLLLCETWDAESTVARLSGERWQQLSPPSVVWVFDRGSASALLRRAGLEPTGWRRFAKAVSVGLVAGQLAGRVPTAVRPAVRSVAGALGRVRVQYGLGDLVMASARRP